MNHFIITICSVIFLTGCAPHLSPNHIVGPKTYTQKMDERFNLMRRSYLVHVPGGYDGQKHWPLVVVIHGAFDTAKGMEAVTGFSDLADREKFLVLYPNGISLFGFLQHWNAGHCCGKAAKDDVDDVGFILSTIEDVSVRLSVDRSRIYMVGFSNGGMMAYRFAAEKSHILAAVAPLAASIGGRSAPDSIEWQIPVPEKTLPLLTMHGMDDQDIPFEGGTSPRRGGTRTYWSVADSIGFWVKQNQCAPNPSRTTAYSGQVQLTSWKECAGNSEIVLYQIKNWEHVWPGPYFIKDRGPDDPLKNFDAAQIIWDFFKRHARESGQM